MNPEVLKSEHLGGQEREREREREMQQFVEKFQIKVLIVAINYFFYEKKTFF
jgi:hypothetical protein